MKLMSWLVFWLCWVVATPLWAAPDDFTAAKKIAQRIYSDEAETFYCACPLRWQGGKGVVDLKSCGYQVRKNGPRANRIEWEHVVPAHQFGKALRCWQQGGREQCGREDELFQKMEADLFNLKPAIGEVNGDRANFEFALLPRVKPQHGACPIRIDFQRKLAEPRAEIRGDIARIYFYMADKYGFELAPSQQQLFLAWHQADPVDDRERQLQQRIAQQMGHPNHFVTGNREWYLGYQPTRFGLSGVMPASSASRDANGGQTRSQNSGQQATAAQPQHASEVLGNHNSKVFHLSHCPGFSQVSEKNQRWFASVQEAEQAGFRRAKNCQ